MHRKFYFALDLQRFADGAAAGGGEGSTSSVAGTAPSPQGEGSGVQTPAAGEKRRGRKPDPFANVQFGVEENSETGASPTAGRDLSAPKSSASDDKTGNPPAADRQHEDPPQKATFDELIKGEYKKDFDAKVQDILGKRLKNSKAAEEQLGKLQPMLELLARKYDVRPGKDGSVDLEALQKAVGDDDELFEQAAAERGMSVDTYKLVHKLETEAKQREEQDRQTLEEQQRRAAFDRLVQQAESAKQVYPGFDLTKEIQNPDFVRLTAVGVDAKTAYEVIHKDEILSAGMQYAVETAAQKVSNAVQAGQRRPTENGLGGSAPAQIRITDPRKLTKEQRLEIRRQVANGKKIVW